MGMMVGGGGGVIILLAIGFVILATVLGLFANSLPSQSMLPLAVWPA